MASTSPQKKLVISLAWLTVTLTRKPTGKRDPFARIWSCVGLSPNLQEIWERFGICNGRPMVLVTGFAVLLVSAPLVARGYFSALTACTGEERKVCATSRFSRQR